MVGNWQVFDFGNGPGVDRRIRIEIAEAKRLAKNKKARERRKAKSNKSFQPTTKGRGG